MIPASILFQIILIISLAIIGCDKSIDNINNKYNDADMMKHSSKEENDNMGDYKLKLVVVNGIDMCEVIIEKVNMKTGNISYNSNPDGDLVGSAHLPNKCLFLRVYKNGKLLGEYSGPDENNAVTGIGMTKNKFNFFTDIRKWYGFPESGNYSLQFIYRSKYQTNAGLSEWQGTLSSNIVDIAIARPMQKLDRTDESNVGNRPVNPIFR